jgi:ferredoxin
MAIKKVWIEEGCTSCGMCEGIAPDVFEMPDEAVVKEGADFSAHMADIIDAAESCPVEVIKYEEE